MTEFKPTWFIAQSDPHRTGSSIPVPEDGTKDIRWFDDMAVVAGVGLLLMVALAIWAKFFRAPEEKKNKKSNAFSSVPDASTLSSRDGSEPQKRKKRRRRRRDHRPRNPTLAETHGLPKLQSKDKTDS